jgi:hypothetical protein
MNWEQKHANQFSNLCQCINLLKGGQVMFDLFDDDIVEYKKQARMS